MIPAADSGLPAPTLWVFLLAAIMWFGMLFIGGVEKRVIGITFTAGLAYVLTFIDGVAPLSKFQTTFQPAETFVHNSSTFWNGMYVILQQVNSVGCSSLGDLYFCSIQAEVLGSSGRYFCLR